MMDFLSHQKQRKRFLWQLMAASMLLFLVAFTLNSCSNKSYDTPLTAQTSATLLPPETLKAWIDAGIVNGTGFDRVVILDVTSQATYSAVTFRARSSQTAATSIRTARKALRLMST